MKSLSEGRAIFHEDKLPLWPSYAVFPTKLGAHQGLEQGRVTSSLLTASPKFYPTHSFKLSFSLLSSDYTQHHPPFNQLVSPKQSFPFDFLKIILSSPLPFPTMLLSQLGGIPNSGSCIHGIISHRTQAEGTQTLNVETPMSTQEIETM